MPSAASSDTGTIVPSGIQLGLGVKTGSIYRIHTQGSLLSTEKDLDLSIRGQGYFQVTLPNGNTSYTRAGAFELDATGALVTLDGYKIDPAITIPSNARSVSINSEGSIQVLTDDTSTPTDVGQLELAIFVNKSGLEAIGENLYLETPASGSPTTGTPGSTGIGTLLQGSLEQSNVNAVSEISDLIAAQRAYEMNAKIISAADEMMQATNNLR
ncbi:MAG: flagellar basal-body rod protein FlgG [Kordiimonadaceae bacterium]|nr:flagellar basal-body rod protein FlgG [Kordiimonadaceae bacterium]